MTGTTYYNLNLPAHGDQNWDTPVNANFESIDALIHSNAEAIAGKDTLPPGVILSYGGTTAPTGFLICDGSAISRTTYADLFAVIGTAYGTGDESTTFNLPNFTNRWLGGNGQGYLNAGLPDISGTFGAWETNSSHLVADNGPFKTVGNTSGGEQNGNGRWVTTEMKLSYANSIYGSSTTVQPATCKTYFIIKY